MVQSWRRRFGRHSAYPTGPLCPMSQQLITAETIGHTRNVSRAMKVLLWASLLREEDPRRVHDWIGRCDRAELEVLMLIALSAIPAGRSLSQAFAWVYELGEAR